MADITALTAMDASAVSNDNTSLDNITYLDYSDLDPYQYVYIHERVQRFLSEPSMVIMVTLGFIAIAINLLSLVALFQVRNRMNSHYRLIVSLIIADTLVGISILLHVINKVFNPVFNPVGLGAPHHRVRARCLFMFIKGLNTTALNISLLNLVGMSLDHYIAINKPLHYPKLMNERRVKAMIVILWILAFLCGYSVFLSGVVNYNKLKETYNYCEISWLTEYEEEYIMLALAIFCLFLMLYIYIQIYRQVSRHRSPGEQIKNDERKNRRALITTLLILGSFMLCWLPLCLFQIIMIIKIRSGPTAIDAVLVRLVNADKYLYDLLLVNSICDPIIYTVRMYEVQLGYRRLFARCLGRPYFNKRSYSRASNYTTMSLLEKKTSTNSNDCMQRAESTYGGSPLRREYSRGGSLRKGQCSRGGSPIRGDFCCSGTPMRGDGSCDSTPMTSIRSSLLSAKTAKV